MTEAPLTRKSQALLLAFLVVLFFLNLLSRVVLAPLLPVIEADLGLNHSLSGSLFMMIAIGYGAGLFGSGFVSARLAHRRTIVVSAVASGGAFVLIAASHTFWMIGLGLLLLGAVTGIYLPSGMTMITSSFHTANWGKAISLHELAPSLAFISAPLIAESLLVFTPWQGILALIGGASIIAGLVFLRLAPGGDFPGEAPSLGNIRILTEKPAFWIMTALFALTVGSSIGIYSMMPLYLVAERGIDREAANAIVGLSRIPLIAMGLTAGWLSDKIGPKPMISIALLFIGIMTVLLGILPGRWVIVTVFLQPLLTVCFFPAGFTVLSRIAPPRVRNLSISFATMIGYLAGAGLTPTLLGVFGDAGNFSLAFILYGATLLLSLFLLPRLVLAN
jgi:NNP family nitrate/nitrite transporter-like MFS transporter